MDQATTQTGKLIDRWLTHGESAWERLPKVEEEIDGWDSDEAVGYIAGWGAEEEMLRNLDAAAASGDMTEEQAGRYRELKETVAKNRPVIERLLNS